MAKPKRHLAVAGPGAEPATDEEWELDVLEKVVQLSTFPILIADPQTFDVLSLSPAAADLFGYSPRTKKALSLTQIAEDVTFMKRVLSLVADGSFDGYQVQRHAHRVDGTSFDTNVWLRAMGPPPRSVVLIIYASPYGSAKLFPGNDPDPYLPHGQTNPVVSGWMHTDGRIGCVSSDVRALLDYEPAELIGRDLMGLIPDDDHAEVRRAFERSREEGSAIAIHARGKRKSGEWRRLSLFLVPLGEPHSDRYGFLLTALDDTTPANDRERAAHLERVVWRVAREIEAAGTLNTMDRDIDMERAQKLGNLTARQWEIMRRIDRGERVPQISREMFISQSTVRNHLSSIFKQFGVHSQSELLQALRK